MLLDGSGWPEALHNLLYCNPFSTCGSSLHACMQVYIAIPDKDEARPPRRTNMDASVMERLAVKVVPGIFDEQRIEFLEDAVQLDTIIADAHRAD